MQQLYNLIKNTGTFYGALFKKIGSWFLIVFKNRSLLKRYDVLIDVSSALSELPRNSWRIRKIILSIDIHKMISLSGQIDSIISALRTQFPNKVLFIQCDYCHGFSVIEFLRLLSCDDSESKLAYCVKFANSLALQHFLDKNNFAQLNKPTQNFSKIFLNKKASLFQAIIILLIACFCFVGLFKIIYNKNLQGLEQVKELSQQLLQVVDAEKLSDSQKFQVFQEYYFFSARFLKNNTLFTYSIATPVPVSMKNLLFTILQKQYGQKVIHNIQTKLFNFRESWKRNKSNRGEYYAYWLAYLNLLYPDHLIVSVVDFQVKTILVAISQSAVSPSFVDAYLEHLKERQMLPTVLIADEFFTSVKNQLQDDGTENLSAFIYFLESKKLGFVSLDHFLKKSDILVSAGQLPALFLKENFINDLLPEVKNISRHNQDYTWFMDQTLQNSSLLFDVLKQKFIALDRKSWGDFLSTVHIRSTTSLSLASSFLTLLMDDYGDFNQLLVTVNKNIGVDGTDNNLDGHWQDYRKALNLLYQDSHYIILSDDVSVAAKDYAVKVLMTGDTHLNGAEQQVKVFATNVLDPNLALGLQDYLLAPLKFYWTTLLINSKESINHSYQAQVLGYYQQYLQNKFPFAHTQDDADPENVKRWLSPESGLFWQFLRNDLKGFVIFKNTWQCNTWLGVSLPIQDQFLDKTNQLWRFASDLFKQDEYHLDFAFYPVPSPLIENESLTIADKVFDYQNGPQAWQYFLWQPDSANNMLNIQYIEHDGVFKKEFKGHWGLLRFLADSDLKKPSLQLLIKPEDLVPTLRELPRNNELALMDEG